MYVATAHCLRASVHGLLAILPFKERVSPKGSRPVLVFFPGYKHRLTVQVTNHNTLLADIQQQKYTNNDIKHEEAL